MSVPLHLILVAILVLITSQNFSLKLIMALWYMNTLVIAIITMIVQTSIVTFAGYAYSRYNFLARKQSLVFFLIIQMVPTMAALTAFFVMALMMNALNQPWFLIFPLCWWWYSNECLVDEGILRYCSNFPR